MITRKKESPYQNVAKQVTTAVVSLGAQYAGRREKYAGRPLVSHKSMGTLQLLLLHLLLLVPVQSGTSRNVLP